MLTRILATALSILALTAPAATWYLDNAATGTSSGTSWANAFTSPTQLTTSVLAPGDTVYVSGGTTNKTYTNGLSAVESGTAANPIRYRIGQEAAHNGVAIFPGISYGTFQYITFDGGRSPSFTPAAAVFNLSRNSANMGFRTTRTNDVGVFASGGAGVGNKLRWTEVGPHGSLDNIGDIHGIRLLNFTSLTNWLIEFCWIHDIQNDGINHNSTTSNPQYWDAIIVRDTLIERTGDDGAQWSCNGISMIRCKIFDHWRPLYNGHPDQIQLAGSASSFIKVVNCLLGNKGNSLIIGEHFISEGGFIGPTLIAGNLFANTRDWAWNDSQAYGATGNAWRPNDDISVNQGFWTNLYVLGNTVYYQQTTPFGFGRAAPSGETRSVWDLRINGLVANNLIVDSKYNTSADGAFNLSGTGDPSGATNQVAYLITDFPASNNIVAGPNRSMTYHGVTASSANAHGMGNSTNMPLLNTNDYSMELAGNDDVARNKGISLEFLTNGFPELMTDLAGTPRGRDVGWDIGGREAPLTFSTQKLALWIRFRDDLSDGVATDSSPYANHAKHVGYLNDQAASNRFPISITMTNPFTDEVHGAAWFERIQDGWGAYGQSGRYAAVTNTSYFNGSSNVSVMAWVFHAPYNSVVATNFDLASNPRWFSSGFAYAGGFAAGLFGDQWSQIRVYNATGANEDHYVWFAQKHSVSITGNYQGYSTNWAHLGFTWDGVNGVLITYLNGLACSTNNTLGSFPFTVRGPSGGLGSGFLMIGGDNHNGRVQLTPEDDAGDQYPNHAWFTGGVSEFMLFTEALTADQMYVIPRGARAAGDFSFGGGGGGGGTPSGGRHSVTTGNLSVGRIL